MSNERDDNFEGKSESKAANVLRTPGRDRLYKLWFSLDSRGREEQFASTARAAELVGMSQRTIQAWIDDGLVQAIWIGRKHRVYIPSLIAHSTSREDG